MLATRSCQNGGRKGRSITVLRVGSGAVFQPPSWPGGLLHARKLLMLSSLVTIAFSQKVQYPGDGPYFATDRIIATQDFQPHGTYQNGLQEVQIPRSTFDRLVHDGVIQIDGHYAPGRSWVV